MEKLLQRRFLDGRRECWLVDQERIRIRFSRWGSEEEVEYPLSVLRDSFDRQQRRPLHWLILAIALVLCSAPMLLLALKSTNPEPLYIALFFLAPAAACALIYYLYSAERLLFRHHDSGKLLFTLWAELPQRKFVNAFVDQLFDCASLARRNPNLNDEQRLSVYRDYLQYLHNESVLSYEEASGIYQRARLQLVAKRRAQIQSVE